ncbi:hypothetical protein [Bernardetia litoralis]|uniref:hypothetical protein n=1 Tax=Bernardetia litoralis TaxID=999 RepID=UPI0012FD78DA|nr:hypothetical protein [Bernardetia litoralis]
MERILDSQNSYQPKSSWKPVLIINGILLFTLLFLCYHFLFSKFEASSYSTEDTFISIFMIACFGLTLLNILCFFISLSFSKKYWRKWLMMIVISFILFILSLVIGFLLLNNGIDSIIK